MASDVILIPYDEQTARRVARLMGSSSAAALALDELERRRETGEDVYLWLAASSVVVGPMPVDPMAVE